MFSGVNNRSIPFERTISPDIFHKSMKVGRNFDAIDQFIKDRQLNFLIILGPSGSGKKTILTEYFKSKRIDPIWEEGEQYGEGYASTIKIVRLPEIILKVCLSSSSKLVHVFSDFPTNNAEFNRTSRYAFACSQGKVIFLLNSTIFNKRLISSFFKTNEGEQLTNTSILQFKPYSVTELKKIGEQFRKKNGFEGRSRTLEEFADLSNGDARRMINFIWVQLNSSKKIARSQGEDEASLSQTERTTIFHFMGKLLYNKRISPDLYIFDGESLDSKNNSKKIIEKERNIRQMSYDELKCFDPPFYFDPVDLLRNSGLDHRHIEMLLQQNYLDFYFNVRDVTNMADLFTQLDELQNPRKSYNVKQDLDDIEVLMIGWGIMLYNMHCSQVKSKFRSFRKSGQLPFVKQLKIKKNTLRSYMNPTRSSQMIECALYHPTICDKVLELSGMFTIKRRSHSDGTVEQNQIVLQQSQQSSAFNRNPKNMARKPVFQPPTDPDFDDIDQEV